MQLACRKQGAESQAKAKEKKKEFMQTQLSWTQMPCETRGGVERFSIYSFNSFGG